MDSSLLRQAAPPPTRQQLLQLATACRQRPHLHRLLLLDGHDNTLHFTGLASLKEDELLRVMRSASSLLSAAPRAARVLLQPAELLTLLLLTLQLLSPVLLTVMLLTPLLLTI